jgi:hypothetical protein
MTTPTNSEKKCCVCYGRKPEIVSSNTGIIDGHICFCPCHSPLKEQKVSCCFKCCGKDHHDHANCADFKYGCECTCHKSPLKAEKCGPHEGICNDKAMAGTVHRSLKAEVAGWEETLTCCWRENRPDDAIKLVRHLLSRHETSLRASLIGEVGNKRKEVKKLPVLDLTKNDAQDQLWKICANNRDIGWNSALDSVIKILTK